MDKKTEALKQALEALDKYGFAPCDKEEDWQGFKRAITTISEALAEQPAQKQEPKRWAVFCSECRKEWSVSYPHPGKSICAECDAKAGAQQQEPVAWMDIDENGTFSGLRYWSEPDNRHEVALYTSPQQHEHCIWARSGNRPCPHVQPSKPWVGLTDEEIAEIEDGYSVNHRIPAGCAWNFAKDIEDKLKDKNT